MVRIACRPSAMARPTMKTTLGPSITISTRDSAAKVRTWVPFTPEDFLDPPAKRSAPCRLAILKTGNRRRAGRSSSRGGRHSDSAGQELVLRTAPRSRELCSQEHPVNLRDAGPHQGEPSRLTGGTNHHGPIACDGSSRLWPSVEGAQPRVVRQRGRQRDRGAERAIDGRKRQARPLGDVCDHK